MKIIFVLMLIISAIKSQAVFAQSKISPVPIEKEQTLKKRTVAKLEQQDAQSSISQADGKSRIKTKRIKHPGAKEGLYLIDEEGVYHYRVDTISKKDNAMFFRIISQTAPAIEGSTDGGTFTFEDMYEVSSLTGIDLVYEWQPFKNFGKSGVQVGIGFATASGKGYFRSNDASLADKVPRESYTFFSIPLSAGLVYRFEYFEQQWAAPYVAGGGIYNGLIEYRNDSKLKTVGTAAVYGSGGILISLTAFNKELAFKMDREYGFSQLWINAEYRRVQAFNDELDITSNQIGVGIGADY